MDRPRRRAFRPGFDRVEPRELPSGFNVMLAARQALARATGNPLVQGTPAPPLTPGTGTPTPHELARERFHAGFQTTVVVGPGRFGDEARAVRLEGFGGSTQFLHGSVQMAFVIPKDPAAPITGAAYLQDKNQTTGAQLGLDLTADRSSLDRLGRPTVATFAADPNIYAGLYYSPFGTGTVRIRYQGNSASVIFDGRLYTNGITGTQRGIELLT